MDAQLLTQIPHLEEIAHRGAFSGTPEKHTENFLAGDIVIATVNGTDATCKRLRKYKDGIELIANNPTYAPMDFSNQEIVEKPVKIIGKVVELRRKF